MALIARWMNAPAVAAYWELTGPRSVTADHLRAQLAGDGRSVPCLGMLDGVPISYWEIYRADLDPLARYCPLRPHDTGVHVLIGEDADRGGLGTELIRAVADLVLAGAPPAHACWPNRTCATGRPSRRSSAPGSGWRPRWTCPPSAPPS
ncbi:GNAT family N-acetyltransferase [Streptomyces violaceorubidus]